jgi:TRAP-type C4-dicarboxylate transport system substrate-binding protein
MSLPRERGTSLISRRTFAGAVLGAPVALPFLARSGFAATPTHTLKLTFADTQAHPLYAVLKRFAENVNKRTDGAVEIQVFSIGQLGSGTNIMTGMQTGIIDLCAHTSGFIGPLFPRFQVVDLPFLFPDAKTAERVLDGPIGAQLLDLMPAKGIYGLSYGHWGWRVVSTVERKVPEPTDIKAMFRTLNANPIAIDLTEVYLALSQRTIEAIETPMISVAAGKHDEVVRTITTTNHVYNVGVLMASKAKLDALPENARSAIRAAARDMTADWRTTIATASDETAERFKAKGLAIVQADQDAYRKQVDPVYKQFRNTIGPDLVDSVLKEVGKG